MININNFDNSAAEEDIYELVRSNSINFNKYLMNISNNDKKLNLLDIKIIVIYCGYKLEDKFEGNKIIGDLIFKYKEHFLKIKNYYFVYHFLKVTKHIELSKEWIIHTNQVSFLNDFNNWKISDISKIISENILKIILNNIFNKFQNINKIDKMFVWDEESYFFQVNIGNYLKEIRISNKSYNYFTDEFSEFIIKLKSYFDNDSIRELIKKNYELLIKDNENYQKICKIFENIINKSDDRFKESSYGYYSLIIYRYIISMIIFVLKKYYKIDFYKNYKKSYSLGIFSFPVYNIKYDEENYFDNIDSKDKLIKYINSTNDLFWKIEKKEIIKKIIADIGNSFYFSDISNELLFLQKDIKYFMPFLNKIKNSESVIYSINQNNYKNEIRKHSNISELILNNPEKLFLNIFTNKNIDDISFELKYIINDFMNYKNISALEVVIYWWENIYPINKETKKIKDFFNEIIANLYNINLEKNNLKIYKIFLDILFNDVIFKILSIYPLNFFIDLFFIKNKSINIKIDKKYFDKIIKKYFLYNKKLEDKIIYFDDYIQWGTFGRLLINIFKLGRKLYKNDKLKYINILNELKEKKDIYKYKCIIEAEIIVYSIYEKINYKDKNLDSFNNDDKITFFEYIITNFNTPFKIFSEKIICNLFLEYLENYKYYKEGFGNTSEASFSNFIRPLLYNFDNIKTSLNVKLNKLNLLKIINNNKNISLDYMYYELLQKNISNSMNEFYYYIFKNKNDLKRINSEFIKTILIKPVYGNKNVDYNKINNFFINLPNDVKIDDSFDWNGYISYFKNNKYIRSMIGNKNNIDNFIIENIIKKTHKINLWWLNNRSVFYEWFHKLDKIHKGEIIYFFDERKVYYKNLIV